MAMFLSPTIVRRPIEPPLSPKRTACNSIGSPKPSADGSAGLLRGEAIRSALHQISTWRPKPKPAAKMIADSRNFDVHADIRFAKSIMQFIAVKMGLFHLRGGDAAR